MGEHEKVNGKIVVGLTEKIKLIFNGGDKEEIVAKVDTGATKSSIDSRLASKLKLGPITRTKVVKSAQGNQLRPVIEAVILLAGKKMKSEFTLADRSHMRYKVLIGVNILENEFLVDPSKNDNEKQSQY
ncbi:hypothetical protein CMO93_04345 [Candidatus Woesearchaeota archaeon]|nr:hypothetical protein [Candidatus Woesearchaeota archaeon]|tara:strand:- start:148 stop:534 length:387 start_codon:yes stop_codon:yes gene_type:complete